MLNLLFFCHTVQLASYVRSKDSEAPFRTAKFRLDWNYIENIRTTFQYTNEETQIDKYDLGL